MLNSNASSWESEDCKGAACAPQLGQDPDLSLALVGSNWSMSPLLRLRVIGETAGNTAADTV